MKKILMTILTFLLLLSLVACNNEVNNDGELIEKDQNQTEENENKAKEENTTLESIDFSNLPQFEPVNHDEQIVILHTSKGDITIKLFNKYAPKAVDNFLKLSLEDYYDGVTFHRVIEDFMIQGGDPTGTGMGGESAYGKMFEDEFNPLLFNVRGALSMANSGPNTNGSQFFIVQNTKVDDILLEQMEEAGYPKEIIEKYKEHGGAPWLDFKHTVFGQVIDGMDVVDEIAKVEVNEEAKPLEDVIIKDVEILK